MEAGDHLEAVETLAYRGTQGDGEFRDRRARPAQARYTRRYPSQLSADPPRRPARTTLASRSPREEHALPHRLPGHQLGARRVWSASQADDAHPLAVRRLAALGKLWATVKYFHPAIDEADPSRWDDALFTAVPSVQQAATTEQYTAALTAMLSLLEDPVRLRGMPSAATASSVNFAVSKDVIIAPVIERVGSIWSLELRDGGTELRTEVCSKSRVLLFR